MAQAIKNILANLQSPLANQTLDSFVNGGGTFVLDSGYNMYERGDTVNGLIEPGKIHINETAATISAAKRGLPVEQVLAELYIHELGHFVNRRNDAMPVAQADKEAWCYQREGEAALFSFQVANEARQQGFALGVPGTNATPDLYYNMLALHSSLLIFYDPKSNAYLAAMAAAAGQEFSKDPKYQAYCKAFAKGKLTTPPPYQMPGDYADSDGGGSGGGGGESNGGGGGGGGGGGPNPGNTIPKTPNVEMIPG